MNQRFESKTVLVTGASSGIGEAAARRFSAEGASLVLVSRTENDLKRVAADLPDARTLVQVADVSDETAVNAMIATAVERFGTLNVLVNNAGNFASGDIAATDTQTWRAVLGTDLDGVFFGCRAALPHLEKSGGCIINTASVSGLGADWGNPVYNAAKGAIVNLTRALALDYGQRGVRVNAVCPTLTRTGMTFDTFKDEKQLAAFRDRIPLGRTAEPDDIAGPIAFLASEDARFITGVNLPVDGGLSASDGQPR